MASDQFFSRKRNCKKHILTINVSKVSSGQKASIRAGGKASSAILYALFTVTFISLCGRCVNWGQDSHENFMIKVPIFMNILIFLRRAHSISIEYGMEWNQMPAQTQMLTTLAIDENNNSSSNSNSD